MQNWKRQGVLLLVSLFCYLNGGEMVAPKVINAEWEAEVFGIQQGPVNLPEAVQELTAGVTGTVFGAEFIETLREVVSKEPTGEYVEYWPSGKLKVRLPYKSGKANGHLHGWYEDGSDAFKGFYKEGLRLGIHMSFHLPQTKDYFRKARVVEFDKKGNLDGQQTRSHLNGRLALSIYYHNGVVDDVLYCWDNAGKEYIAAFYKKNILQKDLPPEGVKHAHPEYLKYDAEILRAFEKEVASEFHIRATASGGRMPFDIEEIGITFDVPKEATVSEARELEVKLVEKLTKMINAHEGIRPYLRDYPFPTSRARVSLSFEKPRVEGQVSFVCWGKGDKICYKVRSDKEVCEWNKIHEEPYEVALRIVEKR